MSDWLELELADRLARVTAPEELWERIQQDRPKATARAARWPVAAAVTLAVAAATLWLAARGQETAPRLEQLAAEQLRGRGAEELQSQDPAEVAAWIGKHAGVDVRLPARGRARLTGARVIRKSGLRIAAVDYTVDGQAATLLLARGLPVSGSAHGRAVWQAAGVSYALAYANREHPEAACLLCHTSL